MVVRTWLVSQYGRLETWWYLKGQFSALMRLISPRRRRLASQIDELTSKIRYVEAEMENLRQHIADATDDTFKKELEASIASTDEAALFERIFGHPPQPSERGGQ